MAEFVNTIDLLGDEVVARKIVDRTIEELADDVLTRLSYFALSNCANLKSINCPNLVSMGNSALQGAAALESVNLPRLESAGGSAISGSKKLERLDLPSLKSLTQTFSFDYNEKLKVFIAPKLEALKDYTFHGCKLLDTLVLASEKLCVLEGTGVFYQTPFYTGGTGGTVYVPQALITQYQNATNWSTLYAAGTCNFVAIEGSEYE